LNKRLLDEVASAIFPPKDPALYPQLLSGYWENNRCICGYLVPGNGMFLFFEEHYTTKK